MTLGIALVVLGTALAIRKLVRDYITSHPEITRELEENDKWLDKYHKGER